MKVTAFIRKTSAKNNVTDLARVYFRVRDIGGVDIKAASELSISPNHWSAEKQGYKPRVALVSEEKRMNFDRDIQQITHLITKEYHRGVDGNWLKRLIEEYHHPDINARGGNKAEEYHLVYQISRYIAENTLADDSYKHHLGNIDKISRYERFQHEVLHRRGFKLCIDTITADDLREFKSWLQEEHNLADPFYLTLEERDRVYYADLSGLGATHPIYRDIFMFQCLIGCRVSDLNRLTKANVVDGCVEYIPQKTKMEHANTVRVPLNQKALDILERYKDLEDALLPRFSHFGYNKKIKEILKYVGIDRMVRVLDPKTREDVARPLYEVATTHTARKTFIGNLYKQVKDPNLIASMSGHSEGSRAFVRYRKIDDDMKKELVNLLD